MGGSGLKTTRADGGLKAGLTLCTNPLWVTHTLTGRFRVTNPACVRITKRCYEFEIS